MLMARMRMVDLMVGPCPKSELVTGRHLARLMDACMTMLRHPKNIAPNPYQLQPVTLNYQ